MLILEYKEWILSMKGLLESVGGYIIAIVVFFAIANIALLFIYGGLRLSEKILYWLFVIIWIVFIIDIIIIIPLGLFKNKRAKGIAAIGLLLSSYIFGLTLWLWALLLTYLIWGMIAVIIGLLIIGVGVVPIALLATIVNGEWGIAGNIVLLIFFTYSSRVLGNYFSELANEYAH